MSMEQHTHFSDEFLLGELQRKLEEKNALLQSQTVMLQEMEEMNARLREAEQVKSGFLSNIRNEINNPLTSILGLSGQLIQGSVSADRYKHIATLINQEAFRLDFQLRNIFSAAEIEAGEMITHGTLVDIDELVQSQINYFQLKATERNVEVEYQFVRGRHFKTDGALLQSVVMNLLANAIEFSPLGGKVQIHAEIIDHKLVMSVQDFGEGIDIKRKKHIFERFRQLDSGTTKSHQGHGLGLSIVKEFVDALGGDIQIHSDPSIQTIVTFVLPEFEVSKANEGFSFDGQEILFGGEEVL
jgi:signal transduction histidine kinase